MCENLLKTALSLTAALVIGAGCSRGIRVEEILGGYDEAKDYPSLSVLFPHPETEFPPDLAPTAFTWREERADSAAPDNWLLVFRFGKDTNTTCFLSTATAWKP